MSAPSQKQQMKDALHLTEGNLTSLIGARDALGLNAMVIHSLLIGWRGVIRKALGHINERDECICPKCGIRHGGRTQEDPTW